MWKARLQSYLSLGIVLFLIFVLAGDRFLPKPLNTASLQTRNQLNHWMVGLFPQWKPKTNPYQRTEDAVRKEDAEIHRLAQ